MTFDDLRLHKPFLDAVRTAGYETPTPIQAKVIPLVLDGEEVIATAQTGTGKTAAFALPILQRLSVNQPPQERRDRGRPRPPNIRSLVLAPTRELAQQIADSFATYGRFVNLRHTVVFGGVNKNPQLRALRAGVDILVATPGRLLDHMGMGAIRLDSIEMLVLDEADRMLDMGFMPDIRRILTKVPQQRQTLLFSATMPQPIRELARDIFSAKPVSVEVARVACPAERVDQWAYHVEKKDKAQLLCNVLQNTAFSRALVFTRTKHGADKVVKHLIKAGLPAVAIHGNKSQNARTRALANFRSGKTGVMVATDIAARGLDIDDISHVINYDLSDEPETYVHRIGRTARAGASGTAMSFVSGEERGKLRAIERLMRIELQPAVDQPGYIAPKVMPQRAEGRPHNAPRGRGGPSRHGQRYAPKAGGRRRPGRGQRGPRNAVASS